MTTDSRPALIPQIQYLRALAVIMVVIAHLHQTNVRFFEDPLIGDFAYFGFGGVDVFFVISGFIIHRLYGELRGLNLRFFLHRLNRIYPLYWVFTAAALLGYFTMGDRLTLEVGELDLIASLSLHPAGQPPVLMVGWTLTHELYFYLVYGLMLALPLSVRPWAIASWAGLSLFVSITSIDFGSPWIAVAFSPFNLLFLGGALIAQFEKTLHWARWPALALTVLGAGSGLWYLQLTGLEGLTDVAPRVALLSAFAIGCVLAAILWKPVLPARIAETGNWSYSIYLSHILAIGIIGRLWPTIFSENLWTSSGYYFVSFLACLAVGYLAHRLIETPLLQIGKTWINQFTTPGAR